MNQKISTNFQVDWIGEEDYVLVPPQNGINSFKCEEKHGLGGHFVPGVGVPIGKLFSDGRYEVDIK